MKIVCKNCGWSWNRNDGGFNPCKCHKCGYNNKDMYGKKIVGLGAVSGKGHMHKSTIKAAVNKKFKGIKIIEIKKFSFGIFSVKVTKQMPRSIKHGNIFGEYNEGEIKLDNKINWL